MPPTLDFLSGPKTHLHTIGYFAVVADAPRRGNTNEANRCDVRAYTGKAAITLTLPGMQKSPCCPALLARGRFH